MICRNPWSACAVYPLRGGPLCSLGSEQNCNSKIDFIRTEGYYAVFVRPGGTDRSTNRPLCPDTMGVADFGIGPVPWPSPWCVSMAGWSAVAYWFGFLNDLTDCAQDPDPRPAPTE